MIDINLFHAEMMMNPFQCVNAAYYGYADELGLLDLSNAVQADYAIRKWLLPNAEYIFKGGSARDLVREAMRFCITINSPFSCAELPGVDISEELILERGEEYFRYSSNLMKFQLRIWINLFPSEDFAPAELANYRRRVDPGFFLYPHLPHLWTPEEYRDWTFKPVSVWE